MPVSWIDSRTANPAPGLANVPIGTGGGDDEQFLVRAFRTFAETASSLELSYATLRREVARLEQELAASNSEVARTSEENGRIRAHLDRILEGLPCGVLVTSSDGRILRANPEARRILGKNVGEGALISTSELPATMRDLLELSSKGNAELERKIGDAQDAVRWLALRHAALADGGDIFILRDVSERKSLDEIEAGLQRDRELAAISALLAHEIRNPLGSLELFAGLLMESPLDPEQRHWVEHVQAGTATQTAPYVLDSTTPSGVRYVGNSGVNAVTVGDHLAVKTNLPGSQLLSAPGTDVFQAIQDLITNLQSGTNIDAAVTEVSNAYQHINAQRVFYGNAINQLNSQQTFLNNQTTQLAEQASTVGGADLSKVISDLVNAQTAREATLGAVSKTQQTNLFDYIK